MATEKEVNNIEASDEEIESSLMAQYLPTLVKRRQQKEQNGASYYNNIILFQTKRPEILKNTVLSFNPQSLKPIFDLTTLQLSNLVPVIQIYKIYKKRDGKKELEVYLPFPEYTYKDDLEQIFESRTGRGAGVGIKSFQWSSMAKNQANLAQFSADLKLYLQDASELTKIRNQVTDGKRTYSASIMDLLYPTNKDGKTDSFEYDPENFFLKVRVGWQTKQDINDPKVKVDNRLLKNLVSEYHLTLYKHDIDFAPDGSVTIDVKFIAMAEALLDDYGKSDIFFEPYVDENETKKIKEDLDNIRSKRRELRENIESADEEKIEKEIKELETKIEQSRLDQKRQKRFIYKNFLKWMIQTGRIDFFSLPKEQKQELKSISTYKSSILDSVGQVELIELIKSNNEKSNESLKLNAEQQQGVQEGIEKVESEESKDSYSVETDKVYNILKENIKKKYENVDGGDLIVPFFYLGDMIEYFVGRFADSRPETVGSTIPSANILNKKIRVVLGTFSYSDYGNPQASFQNGGVVFRTKSVRKGERKKVVTLNGKKETANLAHIPISFKSFLNWFNKKIIDSNLEKYSLNRFIRDVMYDLVPANLTNRILRATPATRINISMNSESVDDNLVLEGDSKFGTFLQEIYQAKKNYIIDFDDYIIRDNPFQFLKSVKSEKEIARSNNKKDRDIANYIFLFSNNEYGEELAGNYDEDINKNSILHFYVGEERGMIKEIKFTREDNPRLDAHNIQVANQENQGGIIRSVYHANIEMFGNNILVPGNLIYINPTYPGLRMGDSTLLQLGLGGYFVVLKTTNKISGGLYTTSIETKWQSFGVSKQEMYKQNMTPEQIEDYVRQGFVVQIASGK